MGGREHRAFWKGKLWFLRKYFPYKDGIPSEDIFWRFFRAIDPATFRKCFVDLVKSLNIPINNDVI
ncbi:MAG: transposase family protein [Nitrospinota bacterium]